MREIVIAVIVAASIPSALTGFCFWLIQQKIQKQAVKREQEERERRQRREERERLREQNQMLLLQSVNAALEYAEKVKHEQKDFLTRQGLGSLYD